MSRITGIPVRHDGASYAVTVGWDPPLRTFYGQVYDADADEWDPPLKSVGMYKRLNEVRDLIEALGHPYGEAVEQDAELRATLEDHREADDSRTGDDVGVRTKSTRRVRKLKPQVPEGLRVRYTHRRLVNGRFLTAREYADLGLTPALTGGMTDCELLDAEDAVVAHGSALCSDQDHYNRRLGRDIALGRALKSLR